MVVSAAKSLAVCRIGFGLYYLSYAWDKISKNWLTDAGPLTGFLFGNPAAQPPTRGTVANAEAFYRGFLESVVQPNPLLFSQLLTLGELVTAVLLTVGLLTRFGALTGIFLNVNYMLMKGFVANGGSIDRLFALADLAFLLGAAGLVWGLDGLWRDQLRANPITRWLAGLDEVSAAEPLVPAHAS